MTEQPRHKWNQRRLWFGLCLFLLNGSRTGGAWVVDNDDPPRLLRRDNAFMMNEGNATQAPTSNATMAPTSNATISPSNQTNVTTVAPTLAPTNTTNAPTAAPKSPSPTANPGTAAPTLTPTATPTVSPSLAPTGTKAPTTGEQHKGISFWRFVEKTIAYMILLVLALLGFGAFMANRYRIYFFLRGVGYTILQMECTLWLMRKLRIADYFGYQRVDPSLNTSILFENELNEGLLMRETDT